jgi:hypothetical protein
MIEILRKCKWEHTVFKHLHLLLKLELLSKMPMEWNQHIIKNLTQLTNLRQKKQFGEQ